MNHHPSYKQGYARYAHQSAYPGLWRGLAGAWFPTLGVTGAALRDVGGRGNHGTLNNGPTWGLGHVIFDGADQYAAVPSSAKLDFSDVTIAWRMKWSGTAVAWDGIISRGGVAAGDNGTGAIRINSSASDHMQFRIYGKWTFDSNVTPSTGWESWALVKDGTTYRWYRNGLQIAQTTNSTNGILHQDDLWIGRYKSGESSYCYYNGLLDYGLLSGRAFVPEEIRTLHDRPDALITPQSTLPIAGGNSPTSHFYGPLVGPLGGAI